MTKQIQLLGLLALVVLVVPVTGHADSTTGAPNSMRQLTQKATPEDVKNAEIDFEYDAVKCAAYYNLESALAKKSGYGDTQGAKGMAEAAIAATQLAYQVSGVVGMSEDALKALLKLDMAGLVKSLGPNYVNSPLVLQTVGMPCKRLLEHPKERLGHWLDVEQNKKH